MVKGLVEAVEAGRRGDEHGQDGQRADEVDEAAKPAAACRELKIGPGPPSSTADRYSTARLTGNAPGPTRPMEMTVKEPARPAQAAA
jgi:hypothetical protein